MGYETQLAQGVAELLQTLGVGTWTPDGIYDPAQTGIYIRSVPDGPDRLISLSTYTVGDDPSLSDSVVGMQIRTRWGGADPRPVDDLADEIFTNLHGLAGIDLSTGIHITQCLRQSAASLGQESDSRRWGRSDNYHLTVHRPSNNRQ